MARHRKSPRALLVSLYEAALAAVEPSRLTRRALREAGTRRALARAGRVGVFAVGKAAAGMARGALSELGRRDLLVVLPRGDSARGLPRACVRFASHPEPDASSVRAAREALRFFGRFGQGDVIVCLVSGGASSLLALPRPGVTLAQKTRAVRALAREGASILKINRLRTSLSAAKGGRLGRATRARLVTLVLSDVPGNRAAAVGSGPTVRGRRGDRVSVVGSNADGLAAAEREARGRGLFVVRETRRLSGDAAAAGRRLARRAKGLRRGTLLLAGGETVVALERPRGRGGRCLELALSAAENLERDAGITFLAAGSDGRDGSAGAAGAFADAATVPRARRRHLDPRAALAHHDTRRFFGTLGDLFVTGPTGTNVGDWVLVLKNWP